MSQDKMTIDDHDAARILLSMSSTPTTATFGHFRHMSLDSPHLPDMPDDKTATKQVTKSATKKPTFSIFKAFLEHDDLLLYLTTQHFEPQEFFELYAMSTHFFYLVNLHMTSYILCSARRWARLSHQRPSQALAEPSTRILRVPLQKNQPRSRRYHIEHDSAARQEMQACGTEATPIGIYSPYDITTLLPFHNYLQLCKLDPTVQKLSRETLSRPIATVNAGPHDKGPAEEASLAVRWVPTFKYLQFLLHRTAQIHSIIASFLATGHRLPILTPSTLARLSLLMTLPLNSQRLTIIRSTDYFTHKDLYIAQLFFVKLDLLLTDPVDGNGETMLRKVLLAQRGLGVLEAVLARRQGRSLLEVVQLWTRTFYRPPAGKEEEFKGMSICNVPYDELGRTSVEGWGLPVGPKPKLYRSDDSEPVNAPNGPDDSAAEVLAAMAPSSVPRPRYLWQLHPEPFKRAALLRPDDMVIGEAVRRGMPLHQRIVEMMLWGYVDLKTGENLPRTEEERVDRLGRKRSDGGDDDGKMDLDA